MPPAPRRAPRTMLLLALAALTASVLAACGGDDEPDGAAAELSGLASTGLEQQFSAEYRLESGRSTDRVTSTARVWRGSDSFRLDVETDDGVARYLQTPEGVVSCQVEEGRSTCLQLAGPGEEPPASFDPSLQRLFGETLAAFATGDEALDVTAAVPETLPIDTAIRCFLVGGGDTDAGSADAGTYCLTDDGVPGKVAYSSGTLTLTRLNFQPPEPKRFQPPASPEPLPTDAA